MLASIAEGEIAPLRLNPSWNLTFAEFVEQVRQKLALVGKHRAGAREALSQIGPVFDVGFGSADCRDTTRSSVETLQQWHPSITENLTFVLEATKQNNDLSVQISYETSRLDPDVAARISGYLEAIVSDVTADPGHALNNIILDKDQHLPEPATVLAQDVFQF